MATGIKYYRRYTDFFGRNGQNAWSMVRTALKHSDTWKEEIQTWLDRAKPLYQETLWNGRYYRLDSESGSEVVMADRLCGQFYARLLGLVDIVPEECAVSALQAVYEACFVKFNQISSNEGDSILGIPSSNDGIVRVVHHPIQNHF